MDSITDTGRNVRRARLYRGLSLQVVADRAGRSKGWLSEVERGITPLERRSDIIALADALGVSPADLVVHAPPPFTPKIPELASVRDALTENAIGDPAAPAVRPLRALAGLGIAGLTGAWRAADHEAMAGVLPPMIADLHAHASGGRGRGQALMLLTRVSVFASDLCKELGHPDLAWIAADRARQAAVGSGRPVAGGMAAWAVALAAPATARSRGLMSAGAAADDLGAGGAGDPLGGQVYGMLRLTAALGAHLAGDRDQAGLQFAEAVRVAKAAGEHPEPWEAFGPANAGVWAVTLAVEAGEPARAIQAAALVNPADLVSAGRRAALKLETARAHAMKGDREAAVADLRAGELISPMRIRCDHLARDLVGSLLERSRRDAGGRELRGMAWRMGIAGTGSRA